MTLIHHGPGNRTHGVKRAIASDQGGRTRAEEPTVITLPSAGGTYQFAAGRLLRNGIHQDVRRGS